MKQVLQSLRTGRTEVCEVPCPQLRPGHVLVRTHASLVSPGTERMLVEFGRANLWQKARQQPDRVRQVLDKLHADGLWSTFQSVRSRLDEPLAMGYSNVGTVVAVGDGVSALKRADRVVSNGPHAEFVCVPQNLCARVPDGVNDESAAFTVLGAVALHGVRLAEPTLGETFAVVGLGLVGLLSVQLLRAHGCRVVALDFVPERLELAARFGAETVDLAAGTDAATRAARLTHDRGVDGVVIAAATDSNEPIRQAARLSRKRGRIVLIGTCGLTLDRAAFYEKELSFRVSCSYGPGRYDANYEQHGHDYPLPYVRWTEQRNFEAVLDLLAAGRLDTGPLITHTFPIAEAEHAYRLLIDRRPALGVLLTYQETTGAETAASRKCQARSVNGQPALTYLKSETRNPKSETENAGRGSGNLADGTDRTVCLAIHRPSKTRPDAVRVGFLGAGAFARQTLLPAFQRAGCELAAVASHTGTTAVHAARKFSIPNATTDVESMLSDPAIDAVVIATRHDTHAEFVCRALRAGKHVFVEKPLALNGPQLERIEQTYGRLLESDLAPLLTVGFNRRFAPCARKMAELLRGIDEPKTFLVTINAGRVPAEHWTRDPDVGGGRIVGEACHFIDLVRFLCGRPLIGVHAMLVENLPEAPYADDSLNLTLRFSDGSAAALHYLAGGHRSFPKERLEVFCAGRVLQLDNFRRLRGYGWPGFRRMHLWRQDKGHRTEVEAFVAAIRNGHASPIPFEQLVEVTRASFDAAEWSSARGDISQSVPLRRAA